MLDGFPITVSRTGYTGDLGYELWVRPENAERLWDIVMENGRRYGALPAGMVALDIARIEAGMLMIEVDYISSHHALTEAQKSSPMNWDWVGRWRWMGRISSAVGALRVERVGGSKWALVGCTSTGLTWNDSLPWKIYHLK